MDWHGIRPWVAGRLRGSTYVAGSGLISLWTIIRHWTNGVNFDVVGQVGVMEQWSRGVHEGAQLGATNYLLKMPAYWVVNHLGFLSPHLKLLLLALLCNIGAFIALVYLFEKLLRLYDVRPGALFYMAMLWLATISGRVFWLDYANSRNLEIAGGILVLYLACRTLQQVSARHVAVFTAVAGAVFFADQLQIYAIGGGLLLYAAVLCGVRRTRVQLLRVAPMIGGVIGAVVIDKLLHALATKLLPVSFLTAPRPTSAYGPLGTITHTLQGGFISTMRIFDASFLGSGSAPNLLRQLLNFVVLAGAISCVLLYVRRAQSKHLALLLTCCITAAYGAYFASFQALQPITERYLILVPILLVPLFALCSPALPHMTLRRVTNAGAVAIGISSVLLLGALAISFPERYSKDAYIVSTVQYLQAQHYRLAVGSRDGIPITYFAEGSSTVLPLICTPQHRLVESNLFFDQGAFKLLTIQTQPVPLILPEDGLTSSDDHCEAADILAQFGKPISEQTVPGVGVVRLYKPVQLQLHE